MSVAQTRVSMARHHDRCSLYHSLRILLLSLVLSLVLKSLDVCASTRLACVRSFRSVNTHPPSTKVSLRLAHRDPCLCGLLCLSCQPFSLLLNFSFLFSFHPFPGHGVDPHRIVCVRVRVWCRLEDASISQGIFCRRAQTIEVSLLSHLQLKMSLPWFRRVRNDARFFFTWCGTGSVPFASSYRLTSSRSAFRRSSTSSTMQRNIHVIICTKSPVLLFVIGSSAQLSASFESVVPHDLPCSFLCEHRKKVQLRCKLLFVRCCRHHRCP